jgi:hypothetical protein
MKAIHGFHPSGQPLAVQIRSWRICAPPKESTQRKGGPDAAYTLCSSLSTRVDRRAILGPLPTRRIHATPLRANLAESSGARRGKREQIPVAGLTVVQYFVCRKKLAGE